MQQRSSLSVQKMYRTMEKLNMDYVSLDEEDENPDHDESKHYEFRRTSTLKSHENKPITPVAKVKKSATFSSPILERGYSKSAVQRHSSRG